MLGPKVGGALGVILGILATGYTWYTSHHEGQFSLALCLLGPGIFVASLAMLCLPLNKLFIPEEIEEGKLDYYLRNPTHTTLGYGVLALGLLASGLYFLYLKYGM